MGWGGGGGMAEDWNLQLEDQRCDHASGYHCNERHRHTPTKRQIFAKILDSTCKVRCKSGGDRPASMPVLCLPQKICEGRVIGGGKENDNFSHEIVTRGCIV